MKVAINGMGVVGRQLLKKLVNGRNHEVVLINDAYITIDNLIYLLNNDTIHTNALTRPAESSGRDDRIILYGKNVLFYNLQPDEYDLIFGNNAIDIVFDCTGNATYDDLKQMWDDGAKCVVALGYTKNDMAVFAYGINAYAYNGQYIVSVPNSDVITAAHILGPISDNYGLEYSNVAIFSSYTNSQNNMDSAVNTDLYEQGRAGAWNIVPYANNSLKQVGALKPELNGYITDRQYRAPILLGGVEHILFKTGKTVHVKDIQATLKSSTNKLFETDEGDLAFKVSSDAIGKEYCMQLQNSVTQVAENTFTTTVIYDPIELAITNAILVAEYIHNY